MRLIQYCNVLGKHTQLTILARMGAYLGYNFHTFVWKLLLYPLKFGSYMGAHPGVGACPGYYAMYMYMILALQCVFGPVQPLPVVCTQNS